MKQIIRLLLLCLLFNSALAQDTTIVQTLNFADITQRRGTFAFPDSTQEYRKILMYYTLKCDAATTQDGYACGEWDYLTYTYVYDHTGNMDSTQYDHPHYLVGTEAWTDSLAYASGPFYDSTETYQYQQVIDSVINESGYTVGTADTLSLFPFNGTARHVRSQYLWTSAEMSAAGLSAGDIDRLRSSIGNAGQDISNVRIRMKNSSISALHSFENGGFSEHFLSTVGFTSNSWQTFDLLTPFSWDGTSNVIVEISYDQPVATWGTEVDAESTIDTLGIVTDRTDRAVVFDNGNYLQIPIAGHDFGDEITISFWAYGDTDVQPENSYAFEAVDADNNRVLNAHLPWSNGRIYWDAGEGSGYDRIDKQATSSEYEGNWVHWAFTKNASTGSMKIYKNGQLWHSGTGLNRSIGSISRFNIAKSANGSGIWHGRMDEFRVWDVELDQQTIADWMNRSVDSSHPNWNDLVTYYDFNDETMVNDESANDADASMIGPPSFVLKQGDDDFLNAQPQTARPVIAFVQGDYTAHLDSAIAVSTTLSPHTSLTEFAISDHVAVPLNSEMVYAGYSYTYHADGSLDSVPITTDQSMTNDTLWYFGLPFEVIDRYEIARYITPYGIQLSLGPEGFTWVYDVTDYANLLHDSVDISAGNQQELIDLKFAMISGTPMADVVEISRPWGQSASYSYGNLDNDISLPATDVDLSPSAENFKMLTRFTGHGQQSSTNGGYPHCCEWKDNTHYLNVNGSQAESWHVWQTHDCAQNPVYPQGGTWPGAREGWCPGDVVKDNSFMITDLVSGSSVNLDYDITPVPANNQGMANGNYIVAMQLMQYGAASHALDAEIYDVISPNNWKYYSRTNPFCDDARIVIRNAGLTALTALDIIYKVDGGQPLTYHWSGNLGFMEKEEVVLPIDDPSFWQGNNNGKFIATASAPNGGQDEYAENDTYTSDFEMPNVYEGNFIVRYKTNNLPNENYWQITDISGNVVAERTSASANTTYMDTMDLQPGCYTFDLYDSGDDGLSYWAYPGQGSGFCRLKANGGGYIQSFESEFGGRITHGFSVGILAGISEPATEHLLQIYPNPNQGLFTLEMSGFSGNFRILVINGLGQVMQNQQVEVKDFYEQQLDLSGADAGIYAVRIIGEGLNRTVRVVIQ